MLRSLPEKGTRPFDFLGLGEVMLRLTPPGKERIAMGETFEKTAGGSELNVACGLAELGLRSGVVTALPDNPLGHFVKNRIRFAGVSDDYLVMDQKPDARLGVYYYEMGAYPRKPSVLYDRAGSSFTRLTATDLKGDPCHSTRLFHVSGITLGLGEHARENALDMLKRMKNAGAMVSFDVNYRAALWDEETAYQTICRVLPLVDVLFVSEETSRRMMRRTGTAEQIARGYYEEYGCAAVAMTMRGVTSPIRHSWDSLLFDAETGDFVREAPYEDIEVVDRIGSGDAYVSGVLTGILSGRSPMEALRIGNAMAAIKNTVIGDMPNSSWKEINATIEGHQGMVQSEMNR